MRRRLLFVENQAHAKAAGLPAREVDLNSYFAFEALEQRLRMLCRLIAGQDTLILVIGERGSGKSTLLARFLSTCRLAWKDCRFHLRPDDLDKSPDVAVLHNHPTHVFQNKANQTMIIDDAHRLGPKALEYLQQTIWKPTQPCRSERLVLFGEPSLNADLNGLKNTREDDAPVSKVFLPAMTEDETAAYLSHRSSLAGVSERRLLSRRAVRKIHHATGGLPGPINIEFDSWLQKRGPGTPTPAIDRSSNPGRLRHFLNVITAAGEQLAAKNMLHKDRWQSATDRRDTDACRQMVTAKNTVCRTLASGDTVKGGASYLKDFCSAAAAGQLPLMAARTGEKWGNPPPEKTMPCQLTESLSSVLNDDTGPNILREQWLLGQDPSCYTIQVLGVRTEVSLARIIVAHRLPQHRYIASFLTSYRGEPAYPLLWGVYRHLSDASSALEELPEALKKFHPMIRRLSSIQNLIRTGRIS
jgi:type II secretory pathway predicted ATPase ExeA